MRFFSALLVLFLVVAAFIYFPDASTDLDSLLPVETLCVQRSHGQLVITGESVCGKGKTWDAAMEDLQRTAAGTVFLETAERIIVEEGAATYLSDILQDERLRPAAQIYLLRGDIGDALTDFATAHESSATIANCQKIPMILEEQGRYRFA